MMVSPKPGEEYGIRRWPLRNMSTEYKQSNAQSHQERSCTLDGRVHAHFYEQNTRCKYSVTYLFHPNL